MSIETFEKKLAEAFKAKAEEFNQLLNAKLSPFQDKFMEEHEEFIKKLESDIRSKFAIEVTIVSLSESFLLFYQAGKSDKLTETMLRLETVILKRIKHMVIHINPL